MKVPRRPLSYRVILLAVLAIGALLVPSVLNNIYYLNLAVLICLYSIVAVGLNVLYGNTGQISLGQAAFYGFGAYASATISTTLGLNVWLSMLVAALLAGALGYGIGLTAVRLKHNYLAMATAAFGIMFTVVVNEWSSLTGGTAGLGGIPALSIGDFNFNTEGRFYYVVLIALISIIIFTNNVVNSRVGRALVAIGENDVAASASGIDASQFKLQIFALSAIYAGLAGALFAHYARYIGPSSFTLHFSLTLMFMIMLGGRGNVWGGVIGAALLTLIPEFLRYAASLSALPESIRRALTEYSYQLLMYGLLVFLFTIFLPNGLVGVISKLFGRLGLGSHEDFTAQPSGTESAPSLPSAHSNYREEADQCSPTHSAMSVLTARLDN